MKATGIIRRIDELGRIVIPKEIRKKLKINEGENIEIYIDEEEKIILKKYSNIKSIKDFVQTFIESIYTSYKYNIVITDTDKVIAVVGNDKKNVINKEISNDLIKCIKDRKTIINKNLLKITEEIQIECYYYIGLINVNGDINGLIIFYSDTEIQEKDNKLFTIASNFLSKYLED